jgi:hypothetical protein
VRTGKSEPADEAWAVVFSGAVGVWLALALIKFGNPVILEQQIQAPATREEFLIFPWPMTWGYVLFAAAALCGWKYWRWGTPVPPWLLVAPLVWLGWQFVSATQTVDRSLTTAAVKHFTSCVAAFYLGLFALGRVTQLRLFWLGLVGGFVVVLAVGWRQHFGGLEETRRFFYNLPNWQSYPPELLAKLSSNRVYSTLFYPNTLAGVILLLLPVLLWSAWQTGRRLSPMKRSSIAGLIGIMGLGCLYWSGSKSGWLIALGQTAVAVALARPPLWQAKSKALVLAVIWCGGLAVFGVKYADYFGRGATSVTARFDYWRAAWQTLASKPLLGSGPGTFMVSYKALKPPEAEMTRLVHNDYLQQGADSGWIGLLAYAVWICGGLTLLYRRNCLEPGRFAVWIGLAGAAAQGCVEFGLYIPAMAWVYFLLFGWLLAGQESRICYLKGKSH